MRAKYNFECPAFFDPVVHGLPTKMWIDCYVRTFDANVAYIEYEDPVSYTIEYRWVKYEDLETLDGKSLL